MVQSIGVSVGISIEVNVSTRSLQAANFAESVAFYSSEVVPQSLVAFRTCFVDKVCLP